MRVLVINLASSPDRLAFQTRQCARLGLAFERLDACTTTSFDAAQFDAAAFRWERPLSPAEYACYLSHQSAWQNVLDADAPTLILEDDACLSDKVPAMLAALATRQDCDLVTLEARRRRKVQAKFGPEIVAGVAIKRLYLDRSGAAAYVLWPAGARKLIALAARRGAALADAHICRAFELRAYQAVPAQAVQADCAAHYQLPEPFPVKSTIWNGPRVLAPLRSKRQALQFKWARLRSQLAMGLRQLRVLAPGIERRLPQIDVTQFEGMQ